MRYYVAWLRKSKGKKQDVEIIGVSKKPVENSRYAYFTGSYPSRLGAELMASNWNVRIVNKKILR